jgi:hypothetical protein
MKNGKTGTFLERSNKTLKVGFYKGTALGAALSL